MKLKAVLENGGITFSVTCVDCPLAPHAIALEQKPPVCVAGVITNMQGAVPVNSCKHMKKNGLVSEGHGKKAQLYVECLKESTNAK